MGILIGGFLFIFGLVFFLTGGGISLVSQVFSGTLEVNLMNLNVLVFGGLGLFFMVLGLFLVINGRAKARKMNALAQKIFDQGIAAEGTITFIDKNYSLLVNNKPIHSIVEFKFQDGGGVERVGRKNNVSSDLAIRLKLEVGSRVQLKYLNEDPGQNILLFPDPNTAR